VFGGEVPIPRHEIVDAVDGMIGDTGEQRPEEDPIHAERKRRAYVSLFASNVALSYRKPPASAPSSSTEPALAAPASVPSGSDTAVHTNNSIRIEITAVRISHCYSVTP